jgi:hypothetical protein
MSRGRRAGSCRLEPARLGAGPRVCSAVCARLRRVARCDSRQWRGSRQRQGVPHAHAILGPHGARPGRGPPPGLGHRGLVGRDFRAGGSCCGQDSPDRSRHRLPEVTSSGGLTLVSSAQRSGRLAAQKVVGNPAATLLTKPVRPIGDSRQCLMGFAQLAKVVGAELGGAVGAAVVAVRAESAQERTPFAQQDRFSLLEGRTHAFELQHAACQAAAWAAGWGPGHPARTRRPQ